MPVKRLDVGQKVLGAHSRSFKPVFDSANAQLLDVFGIELVELPNKERVTARQKRGMFAAPIFNYQLTFASGCRNRITVKAK
jgi:melanoma-associated antigen